MRGWSRSRNRCPGAGLVRVAQHARRGECVSVTWEPAAYTFNSPEAAAASRNTSAQKIRIINRSCHLVTGYHHLCPHHNRLLCMCATGWSIMHVITATKWELFSKLYKTLQLFTTLKESSQLRKEQYFSLLTINLEIARHTFTLKEGSISLLSFVDKVLNILHNIWNNSLWMDIVIFKVHTSPQLSI